VLSLFFRVTKLQIRLAVAGWVKLPEKEIIVLSNKTKSGTYTDNKIRTVPDLLAMRCHAAPDTAAFYTLDHGGSWQSTSWQQFAQAVGTVGAALVSADIRKGDRIGIIAPTSLYWEYAQLGALSIGGGVAGIDPEYPIDQLNHVVKNLAPAALFVQNRSVLAKISSDTLRQISLFIFFEEGSLQKNELCMADLLANRVAGASVNFQTAEPQDEAVIVFSSGTTGMPKAIAFSHAQVVIAIDAITGVFDGFNEKTIFLCWLPLANLFQRIVNFCAIKTGTSSYILSNPRDLMRYIGQVNPDILIGVPKVFERVCSGIVERIECRIWPIRKLGQWAIRTGHKRAVMRQAENYRPGITDSLFLKLADYILLDRLRLIFGSRIRYVVSGSAAMPVWLLEWYEAIGLPVYEVYGISENVVPVAVNRPACRKLGTVGKPLSPNEVKLSEDGEVLVRGPGVFSGYQGNQAESSLRFSADGYWYTGDLGQLDEAGFLSLIGRKGDVFKTAAGKWISPERIEERLKRIACVEQSVVFQRPSGRIVAIIVVDLEKYTQRIDPGSQIKIFKDLENTLKTRLYQSWRNDIDIVLGDLPFYQRPVCIGITGEPFTVGGGELTVNMKVRRNMITQRFSAYFENLECGTGETNKHKQPDTNNCGTVVNRDPVIFFI